MESIFLTVLDMSFKASFLILAVVLLRLVLKRSPRYIICLMWLLVGLRLVLPFSVESTLSLIPQREDFPSVSTELVQSTAQTPAENDYTPVISTPTETPEPQIPVTTPVVPVQPSVTEPAKRPLSTAQIAATVWLCGFAAMLIYLAVSYILLRRRLAEAVPVGEGVWKCASVRSPFVLGFFRPRVYVSYGMSDEQTAYVLAHERAHIARRDHWTKPIGFVILALHWFNPLVWLAYTLLCRDIELACDERVIKTMTLPERKGYSEALLMCSVKASPLAACPLAFGEAGVKQRIKSVLHYKKPAFWIILAAIVCCVAAGVFFLTDPREEPDFDCPEEVQSLVYDFLDACTVGPEEALPYRYLPTEEMEEFYSTGRRVRSYEVEKITYENDYLYFFTYSAKLESTPGSEYAQKYGRFQSLTVVNYAACIDGKWQVISEFEDIPDYILRGEESAETIPPGSEEALSTAPPDISGDSFDFGEVEKFYPATNIFPGVVQSKVIHLDDIAKRAKDIVGSGNLQKYGEAEFAARMSAVTSEYSTAVNLFSTEHIVSFIKDELGCYVSIATENVHNKNYYYTDDAETLEKIELLIKIAPQSVYLDVDDPGEYTISNGLALGMSYAEIVTIMGEPDSVELTESTNFGMSIFALDYPGEALLHATASIGESVEQSTLSFAQIFSDSIHFGRIQSSDRSQSYIESLYGISIRNITPMDYVSDLYELGIPTDGFYDSFFSLVPQNEAIWENSPAPSVHFLFRDKVLECVYIRPAGAQDFLPTIESPTVAIPADAITDTGSSYPLAVPMGSSVLTDLDGDGVQELICQSSDAGGNPFLSINGHRYDSWLKELSIYITWLSPQYYYITDLDTSDGTLEITLYDEGPSGDPEVHFFRYDGGDLNYLGVIPEWFERLKFDGAGSVDGSFRMHILQTWWGYGTWVLNSSGLIEQVPQEVYYSTGGQIFDWVTGEKLSHHPLAGEVYAYRSMSLDSDRVILGVYDEIALLGTDLEEWILVETKLGSRYWLHMTEHNLDTPEGAKWPGDVIMFLGNAD